MNLAASENVTLNNAKFTVHGAGNDVVTLGTGPNSVSFDGGTNTVNAVIGTGATLGKGDSLVGGTGTDTLNLSGKGSLDLNSFNFSQFDTINMSAGRTLTLNDKSLTIKGSAGADTLQFHANLGGTHTVNNFVASGEVSRHRRLGQIRFSPARQVKRG